MYMRKFRLSWTFLVAIIVVGVLAYIVTRRYREGAVSSTLSSPGTITLSEIKYKLEDGTPLTMTAHRVWKDEHNGSVWLWQEDANVDANVINLTSISPDHPGEKLVLNLTTNKYIWTDPAGTHTFDITGKK
jgi:hypothetical protein